MNSLRNSHKLLTIIVIIIAAIFFVFRAKSEKTVSLQESDSVKASVKAVKKRIITPDQARDFLKELDMPTRDYDYTGVSGPWGKYEADSDRFMLETRDPDRFLNNLSYSVFGDKYSAKAVELDLNVNDISFSSSAIGELIKYSDYLIYKVTGKHLTPEIKNAMQTKTSGDWVVNDYKVKLKEYTFPDEEIIKGVESTSDHGAFSLTFLIEL